MLIEKDCVVGIHVRMFDLQKNLLEETEPQGVTYLHGHGDIFPKLEQALEGKKAGDTITVQLEPEEAFGDYDDEAIRLVPVESLGDPELIVPGLVFSSVPGETPDGRNWRVTDVAAELIIGAWTKPISGMDGEDGFLLAADGKAASINSATLVYKSWRREGDKLIMDIESIGNGQTIASTDTMNVLKLDKDSLILDNGGMIMRYHRVRE